MFSNLLSRRCNKDNRLLLLRPHKVYLKMTAPSLLRNAKNRVYNYTPSQIKVREATSNDHGGPSESILVELGIMSFNKYNLEEILQILRKRINDYTKNWRHILKSLSVFEFLCLHGCPEVLDYCSRNRPLFESLKGFRHYDKEHNDQGQFVRQRADKFCNILDDPQAFAIAKEDTKIYGQAVQDALIHNINTPMHNKFSRSDQHIDSLYSLAHSSGNSASQNTSRINVNTETSYNKATVTREISRDMKNMIPSSREEEERQLRLALSLSEKETGRNIYQHSQMHHRNPQQQNYTKSVATTQQVEDLLDLNFSSMTVSQPQSLPYQQPSFDPFASVSTEQQPSDAYGRAQQQLYQQPTRMSQTEKYFNPSANPQTVSSYQPAKVNYPIGTQEYPSGFDSGKYPEPMSSSVRNNVVNDFLGDYASNMVDLKEFENEKMYGMRRTLHKSNPFDVDDSMEESRPNLPQPRINSLGEFENTSIFQQPQQEKCVKFETQTSYQQSTNNQFDSNFNPSFTSQTSNAVKKEPANPFFIPETHQMFDYPTDETRKAYTAQSQSNAYPSYQQGNTRRNG